MNRKIHITQKQLEECAIHINELNVNGDTFLASKNGDVKSAAQSAIDDAQSAGVNTTSNDTNVSFSADALRTRAGITEGVTFTKKQIMEMRVNNMIKNSTCYKAKDLLKH